MTPRQGIVSVCREVARSAEVGLGVIAFTVAGGVLFGLFPAMSAAHAALALSADVGTRMRLRTLARRWQGDLWRVNAVALPLGAVVALGGLVYSQPGDALVRAAALAGAVTALSLVTLCPAVASRCDGGARALVRAVFATWIARPWVPLSLLLAWGIAGALAFVHPLLGLYFTAAVIATVGNRLLAEDADTSTEFELPLGRGVCK